jgi:hypothetical protein
MNIFILDKSPELAAQYQCDKHVVKMVLETAQILSTVASVNGLKTQYKPTHKNHPCTLWAGKSKANTEWLIQHGIGLAKEYTKRYGKIHKSSLVIADLARLQLASKLPDLGLTPFAQAMPDTYRDTDPVVAYRNYYKGDKAGIATWKTTAPDWW